MKSKIVHILLVDDSAGFAEKLRASLEVQAGGVEIVQAKNLFEARRCLEWAAPDLIIAEWLLPDGSGIDLLRFAATGLPCPLMIATARGSEKAAVAAIKAGAWDYIVKSDASLAGIWATVDAVLTEWDQLFEQPSGDDLHRPDSSSPAAGEQFRTFFESAAAGMVTVSSEGYFLNVNEAFCRFSGYARDELLRMKVADVTYSGDLEKTAENYRQLICGESQALDYRKRFLRKGGDLAWGHVSLAAVVGDQGQPDYYVGLVQDITEAKRIQEQVRESRQMLQLVLDYIPQHVFWKDCDSVICGCNRNFARVAGMEPRDLIGKTDFELPWTPEEAEFYRECDRRVMAAGVPELHIIETQLQADGKKAWLDTNKIPMRDNTGKVVGILGTFDDITERKLAEDELLRINRELDAFACTVSHDLRTPLTAIISYAEVLQGLYGSQLDEQGLEGLAKIESQGRRMLAVMEDLLVLAKVGHTPRPAEKVDTNAVLDDVLIGLSEQIIEENVVVKKSMLPHVSVPEAHLFQLFENLLGNAIRYAGRDGAPIEIGAERKESLVRLFVRDHGPGIPADEREQIFELFYRGTADRKSLGTGVGLATVQKIARFYGGKVWVEETSGGGSTFWVELNNE